MNHLEAITMLLRSDSPRELERSAAERHVSRCSDCWSIVRSLDALATDAAPGDGGPGDDLECRSVQDSLYLLAGLSPVEMRARHPAETQHLGWCPACRERLATLVVVEGEAANGTLLAEAPEPPALRPARRAHGMGETVRDAVLPLVVAVGHRVAAFVRLPNGVVFAGGTAMLEPARGDVNLHVAAGARSIDIPLGTSAIVARLTVDRQGPGLVAIEASLRAEQRTSGTIALRAHDASGELVALVTIAPGQTAKLGGVPCGRYCLELRATSLPDRFRASLDIETSE